VEKLTSFSRKVEMVDEIKKNAYDTRWNPVKHGIRASRFFLLEGESEEDFNNLLKRIIEDVKPEGAIQRILTWKAAWDVWRLFRVLALERNIIQAEIDNSKDTQFLDKIQSIRTGSLSLLDLMREHSDIVEKIRRME